MITTPGRFTEIPLIQTLPPALEYDEKFRLAAEVVAEEIQATMKMALAYVGIYYRIDELDERVLDILAYDLHADWYDYEGSVEEKRRLIKNSVNFHRIMGTVAMLRKVIESIHGDSAIEEWMNYGGQPYHFKLSIDVSNESGPLESERVMSAVRTYKPPRAWLEAMNYFESCDDAVMHAGAACTGWQIVDQCPG